MSWAFTAEFGSQGDPGVAPLVEVTTVCDAKCTAGVLANLYEVVDKPLDLEWPPVRVGAPVPYMLTDEYARQQFVELCAQMQVSKAFLWRDD